MNIDWSNAPVDAEAGFAERPGFWSAWYKKDDVGQVMQICQGAGVHHWTKMGGRMDFPAGSEIRPINTRNPQGQEECAHSEANRLGCPECGADFSRPGYLPKPWNGEGLPPAGLEVEILWSSQCGTYVRGKVVAHDDGRAVFRFLEGERAGEYQAERISTYNDGQFTNFRPLRTPEQIAAEKQQAEVESALRAIDSILRFPPNSASGNIVGSTVRAMLEVGYRKQVQP